MDLVEAIYKLTRKFPQEEMYCLTSQLRRSAISIPSNIAEGAARKGNNENLQFLYISLGSLSELETQYLIAKRLQYISEDDKTELSIIEIRKKLLNYIKYLKSLN